MKEQFEYNSSKQGIEKIKEKLLRHPEQSMWLTDLDGTIKEFQKYLWPDGKERKILPETVIALKVLHDKGVKLGIVTGQTFAEIHPWIQEVADLVFDTKHADPYELFNGIIIAEEGGVIKTPSLREPRLIAPKGSLQDREKLLAWFTNSKTLIKNDEAWSVLEGVDPQKGTYVHLPYISETKSMIGLWEKGPSVVQDPSFAIKYRRVKDRVDEKIQDLEIDTLKTYEVGDGSLCITPKYVSKGHTIELLIGVGGLDPKQLVFSCDGFNDVSLATYLHKRGGAVLAVQNAVEPVKNAANYVAKMQAGKGFAEAVAKMFPDEYAQSLQKVQNEALKRISQPDNAISYEQMTAEVEAQMEQIIANPALLQELYENIQHGITSPQTEQLKLHQNEAFSTWVDKLIATQLANRKANPELTESVKRLSQEDISRIKTKAWMHYVVERDLVGPLIYHFANAINTWQEQGMLPGLTVGMLRDFQPFYVAGEQLGAEIMPMYLRRALFSIGDELDTSDVVKDKVGHITKLAYWLKPLLTATHLNLLDSGCWGTLVYEIGALRSAISWIVSSDILNTLDKVAPEQKIKTLTLLMPSELVTLLNTGLTTEEVKTRWGILEVILTHKDYLSEMKALKDHMLTTTGLDHYSHAWSDPRFSNHHLIYSHINVLAGNLPIDLLFGELVNDTIEENHASKIYKGPTQLEVDADGIVHVVLEKNEEFGEEIAAWASCQGVKDAVTIAQQKLQAGIEIDPQVTILHMYKLAKKAREEHVFTGVLPHNTPTWSHGDYFLGDIWPVLANNPYSTYRPFDPEKGVVGHGK